MIIQDSKYGEVELDIYIEASAVDSYIDQAYSVTLDRELTQAEIEDLQEDFAEEIQEYSYKNGSIFHN